MKKARLQFEESGAVVGLLQSLTGLTQTLALRSREAHWNIKGARFGTLHELFGDLYDFANDWVDTLAERIVQQGGVAAALTGGWEPAPELGDDTTLIKHLVQLTTKLAEQLHEATEMVNEDESTKDILIEFNRELERWLWKLEAHLQEVVKVAKNAASNDLPLKTFKYTWVHQPTGKTGTKEWSGLTREAFLEDLASWNRRGYGTWMYFEGGGEGELFGDDDEAFAPVHKATSRKPLV